MGVGNCAGDRFGTAWAYGAAALAAIRALSHSCFYACLGGSTPGTSRFLRLHDHLRAASIGYHDLRPRPLADVLPRTRRRDGESGRARGPERGKGRCGLRRLFRDDPSDEGHEYRVERDEREDQGRWTSHSSGGLDRTIGAALPGGLLAT